MTIQKLLTTHTHEDSEFILAHVLKKPREFIIAHPEHNVNFFERQKYKKCIQKRNAGISFAAIIGHKEFFDFDFLVNKYTLIPRPETEILVQSVCDEVKQTSGTHILFDIGTGSGCIAITLAKKLEYAHKLEVFASDVSAQALKVAKKNAKKHDVNITFLKGSLLEPFFKISQTRETPTHLLITANLPYLTQQQFDEEPSIQYEPHTALVTHDNGLALYKELCKEIISVKKYTLFSARIHLFMEIDPTQTNELTQFIKNIFPKNEIKIKKDYHGDNRVMVVQFTFFKKFKKNEQCL